MTKTKRMTPEEQYAEFKRVARELGADESPEAFERKLRQIAPSKPQKDEQKPKA